MYTVHDIEQERQLYGVPVQYSDRSTFLKGAFVSPKGLKTVFLQILF